MSILEELVKFDYEIAIKELQYGHLNMTKEELIHKGKLAELGCMVCRRLYGIKDSPVELHHLRSGGWGKGNYKTLIPLCPEHHRGKTGVHGLGTKGFAKHYGFDQQDLLNDTKELL